MTYEEQSNWWDENDLAEHLWKPLTGKEARELMKSLGIKPRKR
jgi:hypothetical protein